MSGEVPESMKREEICFFLATIGHTGVTTGITFDAMYERAMDIMTNIPDQMKTGPAGKRRRTPSMAAKMMRLPGCVAVSAKIAWPCFDTTLAHQRF